MVLFHGMSDTGLKRPRNEDSFLIREEIGLIGVADGMGGAAAGELASRIFVEAALDTFLKTAAESENGVVEKLQNSFRIANQRIITHTNENPSHKGMGCTAELVAFFEGKFALAHVGDSRVYLFRQGRLKQLTRDHSLVQQQVDSGLISQSEARTHPLRHVILRAVGVQEDLAVDLVRGRTAPGDLFLLCTDGLTDMVTDAGIAAVLGSPSGIPEKVRDLIDSANSAGGMDNITVVIGGII